MEKLKKKEKSVLEKIGTGYNSLDDKGAIYLLGLAEGMATQAELAKREGGE
jgi:hypothetical protein